MLQKERKTGHWQVERLQFHKREQRGLRLRDAVIDLQPFDLQNGQIFLPFAPQRSPNFSNQTTTFGISKISTENKKKTYNLRPRVCQVALPDDSRSPTLPPNGNIGTKYSVFGKTAGFVPP